MKSAYQNKEFATFWNYISGDEGQSYKKYVIRPTMFKEIRTFKGKTVLDLGCGNGYLGPRFLENGAKKVILFDLSKENLVNAKMRNPSRKVEFIQQSATKRWDIKDSSVDIVYSDMMLNEVSNIKTPMNEAFRVLRTNGLFVYAVTHPAWDLFEFAKKKFTGKSPIIPEIRSYFHSGYRYFVMSTESLKPKKGEPYSRSFKVAHYQRTIANYFNTSIEAGFQVNKILEPPLTPKILRAFPDYKEMVDHPIGMVFVAKKP